MDFLFRKIRIGKWEIPVPVLLWFVLAMVSAVSEIARGIHSINNYEIYAGVFRHVLERRNLFAPYPGEYFDQNHYGPLFSIIIAPFALLPDNIGCFLWCTANAWVLFYAVNRLHLSYRQKNGILLIGLVEMLTAIHNVQFNPMLTGWIILSFVLVEEEEDLWATLFIAAGLLTKIYGIAGIAFFLFSKHKVRFIGSFALWLVVLFCLPMLLSSPAFIVQSYTDWYHSLVEKNIQNTDFVVQRMQDISVMGMIARIFGYNELNNLFVLVPAALVYAFAFLRTKLYSNPLYRMHCLAFLLIGVVIFSSSAESPTYVIAVTGVGAWYVIQSRLHRNWKLAALLFVIVLTSLSATDLVPPPVRTGLVVPYALKALPCFTVWCVIAYQLLFTRFTPSASA